LNATGTTILAPNEFEEIRTDIFYHWQLDVEEDRAARDQLRVFLGWSYYRKLIDPVMPVVIFANRDSVEVRGWPSYFR
jgi:hypothetical protein